MRRRLGSLSRAINSYLPGALEGESLCGHTADPARAIVSQVYSIYGDSGNVFPEEVGSIGQTGYSTKSFLDHTSSSGTTVTLNGGKFIRATSGATISSIVGGFPGDEIVIYARTGTVTVTQSANIQLAGGVDAEMPTRSMLTLVKVPSGDVGWQEKSRSF